MSIERCRSCHAPIVWLKTKLGKSMPVDVSKDSKFVIGEQEYDPTKHISHFATCPNAAEHRKTKKTRKVT
jgi:hypothetical protein